MTMRVLLLAAAALALGAASHEDFERAREAVARGEIQPLAEIMQRVERDFEGRTIALEFEIELDPADPAGPPRGYVYEFELMTPDGRVLEIDVDAATGEVLSVEDDD